MSRQKRPKRSLSKKIVVYCEGDTEKNYLDGLKQWVKEYDSSIDIKIKHECIHGGGYESFLRKIRIEPDSNCIARIVLLDLDRYESHPKERSAFKELVALSKRSVNGRVPCILIGSYLNFEYALCCHDPRYKDGSTTEFIQKMWSYGSLEQCKTDEWIWKKLHSGNCSHDQALSHLAQRPFALKNSISVVKNAYAVKLGDVSFDEDALSGFGSNLADLFKAIGVV